MPRRYRVISADSHLDIRPERWTARVPKRWRDRAPRTVILANGNEGIIVENRPPRSPGATNITGIPYEQHGLQKYWFEGPGTGSPEQRLWEQDKDGIDAEVLFTHATYPHLWRGISEDEPYRAVIRAYNEWLAEEYCAHNPKRLLAMGVVPDTGVDDAIAEMEYCAKAGLKGVNLHRFPSGKSYPTPEDDKFWRAALALKFPVASHTNGGTTRFTDQGPIFQYPGKPLGKYQRDPVSLLFRFAGEQPMAPLQMAMAGVFDRFPDLKIYWAETQIGWLPFSFEQIDDNYERNRYWGEREFGIKPVARRPSEYLKENCLWGFMRDPWGVKCRREIGVDIILWGSDFAHATGNWPHSLDVINETFAGVTEEERYQMLAGNAIRFFRLDAAADLGAEPALSAKAAS
ncbi:MAG TPA: amidohydrolase family protein [Candidatus Acidoferrales bacterium]|nr:amidohydrolase family protein [Candidatus Acidoferrales bacterium]